MTVAALLDHARRALLDLSTRNRLLSLPKEHAAGRIVHVHDERSEEAFRLLVREQKALAFAPGKESPAMQPDAPRSDFAELPQPDNDEADAHGVAGRHRDLKLQTRLTSAALQKRLMAIYYDARTLLEEQGVNILYLALGQLEWYESESSGLPRRAPLVLVPVRIDRKSAGSRFAIAWDQDDLTENLSLAARLKELGLKLPGFEFSDEFDLDAYFADVERAIAPAPRFKVHRHDIALAFFSFAKFLMYRDLDPAAWPQAAQIDAHPKIAGLLRDGFPDALPPIPGTAHIDALVPPARRVHVVDADGSQSLVIAEADRGSDLVVQGPPGTGKSQTITNLIAGAVHAGRKVLFVAEKLAALEVVKRNLERVGLGQIALELHSNKAHKRTVIDELGRTLGLALRTPAMPDPSSDLAASTDALNRHAQAMHAPIGETGLSPFQLIGALALLGDAQPFEHIGVDAPETWTPKQLADARSALAGLASRIAEIGLPGQHVWRGVTLDAVLPNESRAIAQQAAPLAGEFDALTAEAAALARMLEQPAPQTLDAIALLCRIGAALGTRPELDRGTLASTVWTSGLERLRRLTADGRRCADLRRQLAATMRPDAFERDWQADKAIILQHGTSWLRWLRGDYRAALHRLKLAMASPLPKAFDERRALLDDLDQARRLQQRLHEQDAVAAAAFGANWHGLDSRWELLDAQLDWIAGYEALQFETAPLHLASRIERPAAIGTSSAQLQARLDARRVELDALASRVALDVDAAFGVRDMANVLLDAVIARLRDWSHAAEQLSPWVNYHAAATRVRSGPLRPFHAPIAAGSLDPHQAVSAFDQAYYHSLLRVAVRLYPPLAQFEGRTHAERIERFRQLDRAHLDWVRLQVVRAHLDALPRINTGTGALGVLHQEINKKSRHMALRKLLSRAGSVVQQIKPVFMMSPLSVAQFLEPGAVEFDLLVVDEASQVEPVDALGAIARCRQIVVVGDDKQLPPTRFFSRMTGNDAADDDVDEETASAAAVDSILGLCRSRGIPEQMLRWHYRSRHHSLIAISNREFYDDGLFIVPSPEAVAAASGVKLHRIAGVYDRGRSRQNAIEADCVAQAVIAFAEREPGRTLGVVAFSEAQKQAILDRLELQRRSRPDLEPFFDAGRLEPFFVKNLENVQGDERDVIFISVGYGRDADGHLAMAFGPLSATGGERRLNVLISRARWRCDVFASIGADDIDLERTRSRGAAALKLYLKFAETGRLDAAPHSARDADSDFEKAVGRALEAAGHTVHPQVGIAGFFIDLAIVDPDRPGRYVLGIECDGAGYHASRSARDRDRLRQSVLEGHGWRIHRIWSADWLHRPAETLRQLLAATERAIADALDDPPAAPVRMQALQFDFAVASPGEEQLTVQMASPSDAYEQACISVPRSTPIHELQVDRLAKIVSQIVAIEAPVHEDEVVQRVRALWIVGRAGTRIQAAVKAAVQHAAQGGSMIVEDGGFLVAPGYTLRIRNRADSESKTLRQVEMLPPAEIRLAVKQLVELSHRVHIAEVATPVARWLGFLQTSAQLRERIEAEARALVEAGVLRSTGDVLEIGSRDDGARSG